MCPKINKQTLQNKTPFLPECIIVQGNSNTCSQSFDLTQSLIQPKTSGTIPQTHRIHLAFNNRILCFDILQLFNYLSSGKRIITTPYGNCVFSERQIERVNQQLIALDYAPLF